MKKTIKIEATEEVDSPIYSIEYFGAKPYDASFDNGPVIQRAIEECEGIVFVPGKTYYVKSTIVTPNRNGSAIQGVGTAYHRKHGAFKDAAVSRLVWTGEPGGDLIRYHSCGMSLDQLTLVGREWWSGPQTREEAAANRAGCLLRVIRAVPNGPVPTGRLTVGALSLVNADKGVWCDAAGGENHTDHMTYQSLYAQDVDTVYLSTNQQSCHHTIQHVHAGNVKVLFDFQKGGQLSVFDAALASPAVVLRTNDVSINKCNYVIQNLKVDAQAKGWRLLEMQKARPLRLRVGGHVANVATPRESVILGTPDIQTDLFNFENEWKQ